MKIALTIAARLDRSYRHPTPKSSVTSWPISSTSRVRYISNALQRADESTIASRALDISLRRRSGKQRRANDPSNFPKGLPFSLPLSLSLAYQLERPRASAGTRNARRVHNSSRARRMRTLSRGFTTGANHADMNYARAVSYETRVARARARARASDVQTRASRQEISPPPRRPSSHRAHVRGPPSRVFTQGTGERREGSVEHAGSKDAAVGRE